MPSVETLYQELRGQGLEVLLVNIREKPATVRTTVQERGYRAPVLLDESGDVAGKVYGVWGPPTVYLIDRRGRMIGRATGPRGWDSPQGRKLLLELLAEK